MEVSQPQISSQLENLSLPQLQRKYIFPADYFFSLLHRIKTIGNSEDLEAYEQRKLGIFNQLNFFQIVTLFLIAITGLLLNNQLPAFAWLVTCLPAFVSVVVLYLNKIFKYDAARIVYFMFYPFLTCVVYLYGINPGFNLFFILYGILSVFFLRDTGYMVFSISFSMVSYFVLTVVLKEYQYPLEVISKGLYMVNQGLAILFIFYGLYLIKNENSLYQLFILDKNKILQEKNIQITEQAEKLNETANLLKKQTEELTELNGLKNKLFSVVSHDLKAPLHALRQLFTNVHEKNIPFSHLHKAIPEVVKDLNYTTELMENLLHWARTQMQAENIHTQKADIGKLIAEVLQLVRLQLERKKIKIDFHESKNIFVTMDKDMIHLVMRNLVSNAIKFTPAYGHITVGIQENHQFVEVYVMDNGTGMDADSIRKINNKDFFTTKGTANETGTGLGLMLCKEYLARNNAQLHIESNPGTGSSFSFSLPKSS
ncbi:MAG TPA: HAMP domain-containing sensor histidine kinase [Chitinophagaceae bacterium]|nr:HAMP domain-containing sensor histidine kinase [Chitinophagaceae bacterium]